MLCRVLNTPLTSPRLSLKFWTIFPQPISENRYKRHCRPYGTLWLLLFFFCLGIMILMLDVSALSKLLFNVFFFLKVWFRSSRSEVSCRKAWCKNGTRTPGPWSAGPWDPSQSLKVGPPSGTSPFFNEFFFFLKIFYLFLSFFSSFLNNKHEISSYLVS